MALKGIGDNAFMNQSTILSVKFGSQCTNVGENAFRGCVSLSEINGDNVIETIGSSAFAVAALSSATFNKLSYLYQYAFKNCSYLEYISISNCNTIQTGTFQNCVSLSDVNIKNVLSIGEDAFAKCTALSNIDIPNCGDIGKNAFKECSNLTYVNNGFVTVGVSAFYNCSKLKDIYLDRCVDIKNGAFENCTSLNKLNLAQCINIGKSAFKGCTNITQVSLSVCEKIGVSAFANCSKLNRVYIYNQPNTFCKLGGSYVFCEHDGDNCSINNNITFFFRPDVIESYKEDEYWSHYIDNMIMMVDEKQIVYTTNNNSIIEVDENIADQIVKNEYYTNYGLMEFKDKITSLNQKIFKGSTTLTSIDVPSGCKTIGESEFEDCVNLNSITLSNALNRIDDYAFKNCESFTSFTIPQSVTTLGEGIFAGCKNIEKFEGKFVKYNNKAVVYNNKLICVLPKDNGPTEGRIHKISDIDTNIRHLGKFCFYGCDKMRRIDLPSNIDTIGEGAFNGCINLYEIHFKGGVQPSLGINAFKDVRKDFKIFVPENSLSAYNEALSEYSSNIYPTAESNSIIYYGDKLTTVNNSNQTEVKLSYANGNYFKITNIKGTLPTNYFTSQKTITKVILGEEINIISASAFKNCDKLEYIYLSDSITQLGNECFNHCKSLSRIHIPSGLKSDDNINILHKVSFGTDIFVGCEKLKEFGSYYKGYVSDDNRCYIDIYSTLYFFAPYEIEEYTIPSNVIKINRSAFRECSIKNINLSSFTKVIDTYAFTNCSQLTSIKNWDNVDYISDFAFANCTSLSKISIPSKLKSIGGYAFKGCKAMYINTNFPNSLTSIGSYAFEECSAFKCIDDNIQEQVTLNLGKITDIESGTFWKCSSLEKVNINDEITHIYSSAFCDCTSLTTVSISSNSSLNSLGASVFKGCSNLIELNLPIKLTSIGFSAFENCTKYKGIIIDSKSSLLAIPEGVSSIGYNCFKNTGIENLFIGNNIVLEKIEESTFENCINLKSIDIFTSNILSINEKAFCNCTNLCESSGVLKLPDSIKTINDEAFKGCEKILSITIPKSVIRLGDMCFAVGNSSAKVYTPEDTSPATFTNNGSVSTTSNPFGEISTSPLIYVYESLMSTYKNNAYWSKYSSKFMEVKEERLENYLNNITCDTNGFSSVVGNDWGAYAIFTSNIPSEWAETGATIYFNVYDSNDSIITAPGGGSWSFTLANNLDTVNVPYTLKIYSGGYSSLGGTKSRPAKYIKISSVSNSIIKYRGTKIGINNY